MAGATSIGFAGVARRKSFPSFAWLPWLLGVAAHVPLALAMARSSHLATAHAALTCAAGILCAVRDERPVRVICLAAYVAGSEVLWRLAGAAIFWETGKYAIVAMLVLSALRSGQYAGSTVAGLYFAALLPSTILTFSGTSLEEARSLVSFNLSGPLALSVACWYFSRVRLPGPVFSAMLMSYVMPCVGLAAVGLSGVVASSIDQYGNHSNFAASGGYGPNQVSTALGLGALACLIRLMLGNASLAPRIVLAGTGTFLAVQSALTFSRSGIYAAGAAAVVALLVSVKDRESRMRRIVGGAFALCLAAFVIVPSLDAMTGGALSSRFADTSVTNRDKLVEADLHVWAENPILGVGPGMADTYRASFFRSVAAHTEFTRLLAEHGLMGLVALILLAGTAVRCVVRQRSLAGRAAAAALVTWSMLYMLVTAMRIAAPAWTFGVAGALLLASETGRSSEDRKRRARHSVTE